MKYPLSFPIFASRLALGALCFSSFAFNAYAASLYWDTSGSAADSIYGGEGVWNSTNTFWNDSPTNGSGTSLTAWNSAASPLDAAHFLRGTSGPSGAAVTISGTQTLQSLNFSSAGSYTTGETAYTLSGGVLDIRQASFSFVINSTGNNTVNSDILLWGNVASATENNRQRITNSSGTLQFGNMQNIAGFSGTGSQSLSLEGYGTSITNISGNITKLGSAKGVELIVGGTGTSITANYILGGNNTGLGGVATLNRGTLTLNNNNALAGASSLTVANANTGTSNADAAHVVIDTAGVTVNKSITFSTVGTDTNDVRSIGGTNTTGVTTYAGTVSIGAMAASGTGSSLQVTAAAGGRVNFTNTISGAGNITKTGDGVVAFSRPTTGNTYTGFTTISAGTFLANGVNSTGTGAVTVNSGATLGGIGSLGGNDTTASSVTAAAGSFLSAGDATVTNGVGTLTFKGALNISGLTSGTGGLLVDLGATGDQIVLTVGALSIGTDALNFNDFTFTTVTGFGAGTYTLFDTSTSIVGTLGSSLTGTINGLDASLSLANGGQDIVLTVAAIPEPSTYAALAGALILAGVTLRRRSR